MYRKAACVCRDINCSSQHHGTRISTRSRYICILPSMLLFEYCWPLHFHRLEQRRWQKSICDSNVRYQTPRLYTITYRMRGWRKEEKKQNMWHTGGKEMSRSGMRRVFASCDCEISKHFAEINLKKNCVNVFLKSQPRSTIRVAQFLIDAFNSSILYK